MQSGEIYVWRDNTLAYELLGPTADAHTPTWNCRMYRNYGGQRGGVFIPMTGRVSSVVDPSATYTGYGTVTEQALEIFCQLTTDINLGHLVYTN